MLFKNFFRRLPFRMAIGKFGIKLMEFGRFLQVRYANWSSEVRIKTEILASADDPEYAAHIHISEELLSEDAVITFSYPGAQEKKKIPLVDQLFAIQGVKDFYVERYGLFIKKARVFDWKELLPQIEKVVLEYITK